MKSLLKLSLITLSLVVFFDIAQAQDPASSLNQKKTFAEVWHEGGWVMYPLALASILTVALTAEGFINLRTPKLCPPLLIKKASELIVNHEYQDLWTLCKTHPCFLSSALMAGLERIGRGKDAVEHAIQEAAFKEATLLKTRNTYLSVIGVVSPMIGLTGTVVGMIKAFAVLGSSGIADPGALSAKIAEVLTATAGGLIVAIPAFIFYYILRNRATSVLIISDSIVNRLIENIPIEELSGLKVGEFSNQT